MMHRLSFKYFTQPQKEEKIKKKIILQIKYRRAKTTDKEKENKCDERNEPN